METFVSEPHIVASMFLFMLYTILCIHLNFQLESTSSRVFYLKQSVEAVNYKLSHSVVSLPLPLPKMFSCCCSQRLHRFIYFIFLYQKCSTWMYELEWIMQLPENTCFACELRKPGHTFGLTTREEMCVHHSTVIIILLNKEHTNCECGGVHMTYLFCIEITPTRRHRLTKITHQLT